MCFDVRTTKIFLTTLIPLPLDLCVKSMMAQNKHSKIFIIIMIADIIMASCHVDKRGKCLHAIDEKIQIFGSQVERLVVRKRLFHAIYRVKRTINQIFFLLVPPLT